MVRDASLNGSPFFAEQNCLFEVVAPRLHLFNDETSAGDDPRFVDNYPNVERLERIPPVVGKLHRYRFKDYCHRNLDRCLLFRMMRCGEGVFGGRRLFDAVVNAYKEWFFHVWMPRMTMNIASAIRMFENPDSFIAARRFVERLPFDVRRAQHSQQELHQIKRELSEEHSKGALKESGDGREWSTSLAEAGWLMHDLSNIVASFLMFINLIEVSVAPEDIVRQLKKIQRCDFSTMASAAHFATSINKSRAEKQGVSLEFGTVPAVPLPENSQAAFVCIMNEFITNAIKRRDPAKYIRRVRVRSDLVGSRLHIHVNDNGEGIGDFGKFVRSSLSGGGWRERPDRSEGHGQGICSAMQLARQNDWGLLIASTAGVGTDAGIYFDLERVGPLSINERRILSKNSRVEVMEGDRSPNDIFDRVCEAEDGFYAGLPDYPVHSVLDDGAIGCFHIASAVAASQALLQSACF